MRVAKVISTCFIRRSIRQKSYLIGEPVGYFGHSQNFQSPEDVINLIKFNISEEKKFNPGVKKRDLIIVNNDVGNKKGNNFLKKLSKIKIPNGKIIVTKRKNFGMSFGAFSYAFKKFRSKYDYFLFTEDDIIVCRENYIKIGIENLKKIKNAGYLSYIHSTKVRKNYFDQLGINSKIPITCHGAIGLSSTILLNKVYKKYGELPHYHGNDYKKNITFGEVAFPNSFVQMGYKIIDFPKEYVSFVPAYDLMRGINYKKWPNFIEKNLYYIKNYIYKFLTT
tara:strand:+ start:482 stop:1318 length:837 start_codon:yes stop_codon:yes gene_type:complete